MVKISFDIDEELLEDLKQQALESKTNHSDLAKLYLCNGIKNQKGLDKMTVVTINENIMEKVNLRCKQIDCSPKELVNNILYNHLSEVDEMPEGLDGEKIWSMLDHDKPEGDDVLEVLSNVNQLK